MGADVRFVERDGLHRRRRFMSDVGGRAGAAQTFSEVRVWRFADLFLQLKVRSAPTPDVPITTRMTHKRSRPSRTIKRQEVQLGYSFWPRNKVLRLQSRVDRRACADESMVPDEVWIFFNINPHPMQPAQHYEAVSVSN